MIPMIVGALIMLVGVIFGYILATMSNDKDA